MPTNFRFSFTKQECLAQATLAALFFFPALSLSQEQSASVPADTATPSQQGETSAELNPITVVGQLNEARAQIVPSLGATKYSIGQPQIQTQSQGDNAPFNQTLLRGPGVSQDSFGQVHVRDEHANLQYRINDVLIPEGISGFGQEIDTRWVDNVSLITGSLPAQFGFRTTGIVDIHTKEGVALNGGILSFYGGSHETITPSFQLGGAQGNFNYYILGSYNQNTLGIENPTNSHHAIHDDTAQFKGFADLSYIIDPTSRISLLLSGTYSDFQIPNNPGQTPAFSLANASPDKFDSRNLDENQHEQNHYAVLAYQKSFDTFSFQVAAFTRYSETLFTPDQEGDLIFDGVASRVDRSIFSNGFQIDARWALNDCHTLRGGVLFTSESATADTTTAVFSVNAMGTQASDIPFSIVDNSSKSGFIYGFYLQDEWKVFEPLTINFGARFDIVDEFTHSSQLSPRINIVFQATKSTTLHAGYSRYFTPPPLELVQTKDLGKFVGTTNQSAVSESSPVKAERAHYFDAGMTEQFTRSFSMGVDGYYKEARDLLDEGQFGAALIFSPFNYAQGNQYGVEVTASYAAGGFSAYANFGFERGTGRRIASGQFLFAPDELEFVANHFVFLDHDQRCTASAGVSYTCKDTTLYADMLYGDGLRSGFANTNQVPSYYTFNVGLTHNIALPKFGNLQLRFDVVNLFDKGYQLRTGSGIGVFAPQFGPRRGIFGGISWIF
jgi:outer membrane receptor protein involved in Fe transport